MYNLLFVLYSLLFFFIYVVAYLEELQLLLVGETLDLGSLDVSLQIQLLPSQQAQGAVKGLLHVGYLLFQHLLLVLQLAVLHSNQAEHREDRKTVWPTLIPRWRGSVGNIKADIDLHSAVRAQQKSLLQHTMHVCCHVQVLTQEMDDLLCN